MRVNLEQWATGKAFTRESLSKFGANPEHKKFFTSLGLSRRNLRLCTNPHNPPYLYFLMENFRENSETVHLKWFFTVRTDDHLMDPVTNSISQ